MDTVNIFSSELRQTIKKDVPFIPGAYVVFYDDLTTGQVRKAQATKETPDLNLNLELMLSQIADWNFADNEGKLPLTLDTIDRLGMKMVNWLIETEAAILASMNDKKKE